MFERVIKTSTAQRSSQILKIEEAHNKSLKLKKENVETITEKQKWSVTSEKNGHVYVVTRRDANDDSTLCNESCILRCNSCKICIHSFECTCVNYLLYFNICKHIHLCAEEDVAPANSSFTTRETYTPLFFQENDVTIDFQTEEIADDKNVEDILHSIDQLQGIIVSKRIPGEDSFNILSHLKNAIAVASGKKFIKTSKSMKRNVEKQICSFPKKKGGGCKTIGYEMSVEETEGIQKSFVNNTNEVLNIIDAADSEHCYSQAKK